MVNIIKDGDLFTVPADILINPINRAGISGAGLAKEFKRRFPHHEWMWRSLVTFPMRDGHVFRGAHEDDEEVYIYYFPTKHYPKDKISSIELIEKNLKLMYDDLKVFDDDVIINMPALGCGLGGLDFEGVIKPLILDMFQNEPYTINLFEPK